ncbi:YdcF family protein [Crenalkalicoccus roseus]|uniref:YdcF family protein n=1 Tax=Crenalkalicoccus roseus TaxID=1485588 RepID=UPI001081221F|nr:YdcF family protein [Crenalkalicoccus roseus]
MLAWRGRRAGGALAALAALLVLLLATPFAAGWLMASLEREVAAGAAAEGVRPGAIVILGAEVVRDRARGPEVGPLSLERLRAGAALHRTTGLPVLVTGGLLRPGEPSLAALMARSLAEDFGVEARWIEGRAGDTRENAAFSAAMLREAGIGAALVVTHGWHLPRALEAFAREGFPAHPAPLRLSRAPEGRPADWVPRPDHLAASWFALREWAGRLVYALRDGG